MAGSSDQPLTPNEVSKEIDVLSACAAKYASARQSKQLVRQNGRLVQLKAGLENNSS